MGDPPPPPLGRASTIAAAPLVDEVGYLLLERQAANLLFALVSRRHERRSIIVTSNRGFEQWGRDPLRRDGRRRRDSA